MQVEARSRFDNYVVGSANRLAVAAARAVAESPGGVYNPLFVYGGSGLGKTHLIGAIGHEAVARAPDLSVEYLSLEDFIQQIHAAVALGEELVVSFAVPGSSLVFDAEAEVVRIIEGFRPRDPGYCAGLRFTRFDRRDRLALGVDLRGLPPVPRQVRWGHRPAASRAASTVVVRPIMRIGV
jgi:hypothetical protein